MKKVKKNGIGAGASTAVLQWCGRCGIAVEENDFCPESRDFFPGLSGRKVEFTSNIRRTKRLRSVVGGK